MGRITIATTLLATVVIAAGASQSAIRDHTPAALDDPTIVAIFDAANTADIETGSLAAERGASKEVRDFGSMLARDHKQVRQLGRQGGHFCPRGPAPRARLVRGQLHVRAVDAGGVALGAALGVLDGPDLPAEQFEQPTPPPKRPRRTVAEQRGLHEVPRESPHVLPARVGVGGGLVERLEYPPRMLRGLPGWRGGVIHVIRACRI